MVRTRWELATNASTTTSLKKELDTPSATCASSERTLIIYITRHKEPRVGKFL